MTEAALATPAEPEAPPRQRFAGSRRLLNIGVGWAVGAWACSSNVLAFVAVGFVYAWMARTSRKTWWRHSTVPEFHAPWPGWMLSAEPGWRRFVGGLWRNVRVGVVGTLHGFLAVLPSAALWMFAWRYGWDNSFTKGYDLRWIGPVTGLGGVLLFTVTMLVLPLAQARHALTGSWKAFWEVGLLATLAKRSWTGAVPLALAYALVGIPFVIMWVYPVFAPIHRPEMAAMTDSELREWLDGYHLFWAFFGFAAYFALKTAAARWYANALLDAVRAGVVTKRQLHPAEAEALAHYDLLKVKDLSHRHPLVRAADWTASAVGRGLGLASASMLWAFVAFQLFVGAFFHYRPVVGWLNQPLVVLPAFRYVPPGLRDVED